PQPQLAQARLDIATTDRRARARFREPLVDDLVNLLFEIADFLGGLVLDADEADSHLRWRQQLRPADLLNVRRRRMARDKLCHRLVHQWAKRFLPRLMTADHFLLARLDDPSVLSASTAGHDPGKTCKRSTGEKTTS